MGDFDDILNREIVEAGRVPDARVIDRAKELVDILEDYTSDVRILTPMISAHSDIITFLNLEKERGFSLYTYLDSSKELEDEITVYNKERDLYISIRGRLEKDDLDYAFSHVFKEEDNEKAII